MPVVTKLPVARVALSGNRPINEGIVVSLMESMSSDVGLMHPITVRRRTAEDTSEELNGAEYIVVAGDHRLTAAKNLKWVDIDAVVAVGLDNRSLELAQIDENLVRAALSPAQLTSALRRRKELWDAMHGPVNGMHSDVKGSSQAAPSVREDGTLVRHPVGFASDTAERVGVTKRAVNRQLARGAGLTVQELDDVAKTVLDKGVELDALSKLPVAQRDELIRKAKAGDKHVSARACLKAASAPPPPAKSPRELALAVLHALEACVAANLDRGDIEGQLRDMRIPTKVANLAWAFAKVTPV